MIDVPARVKDALRSGIYKKEYRIVVYKTDGTTIDFTIDNTNLVSESVTIDERMCSGSELKFGLCEGSSLEFQYMPVKKITNLDEGMNLKNVYFTLKRGFRSPTKDEIIFETADGLIYRTSPQYMTYFTIDAYDDDSPLPVRGHPIEDLPFCFQNLPGEDCVIRNVNKANSVLPYLQTEEEYILDKTIDINRRLQVFIDIEYKDTDGEIKEYTIPMGWYTVDSVSRQASTGINKITAYNKLRSAYLDQRVNGEIEQILSEAGAQGVQLYRILQILLSGYGIDGFTETQMHYLYTALPPSNYYSVIAYGIPQANGNYRVYDGVRITVYALFLTIPMTEDVDSNNNYRYVINTTQSMYRTFANSYANNHSGFLNRSVWCEETQSSMTLSAYMTGNYEYSAYFGGAFIIPRTNDVIEYGLYYPTSNVDTGFLANVDGWLQVIIPVYIREAVIPRPDLDLPGTPANRNMQHTITSDITSGVVNNASNVYRFLHMRRQMPQISYSSDISGVATHPLYESDIEGITDNITLRELQSAVFELSGQYGKLDRETDMFSGINLSTSKLVPYDTPMYSLCPSDTLLPRGTADRGYKAMYSKLWADENNVRIFRNLIITFKGTVTEEGETKVVEKKMFIEINRGGTDDYIMDDNWLCKNLVWDDADLGRYVQDLVSKLRDIRQFPFEMWCAGLPYIESGDRIEIELNDRSYSSYVLRRTLKGIQDLQDTMINGTLDIF